MTLRQELAGKALVPAMPQTNNDAGVIPPEIASRVFARAVAKDPIDGFDDLAVGPPIDPTMDPDINTLSYIPPRYAPRADWKEKLESLQPPAGSWQSDLVSYWRLRTTGGLTEPKAWEAVGMSPANARQALMKEPPTPINDSGFIPCRPNGPGKETVAKRLFARALAKDINPKDMFDGLVLDPPV
jgi:hypothetical protein